MKEATTIVFNEVETSEEAVVVGRMAYAASCLEKLAATLNYSSPKFKEMLDLLWSYTIMDEHSLPLPPMDRFQKNSLEIAGKGEEIGFPAPRSFYTGD